MKAMILAAASMAMFGSVSYASDYSADHSEAALVYEQEEGAMSQDALDMLSEDGMTIFGATDAMEIQSFPVPRRPGPPGYGRPGRPDRPRMVTCFARNARGQMFRATDRNPRWAQNQAMRKCERVSRICRPAGCR